MYLFIHNFGFCLAVVVDVLIIFKHIWYFKKLFKKTAHSWHFYAESTCGQNILWLIDES